MLQLDEASCSGSLTLHAALRHALRDGLDSRCMSRERDSLGDAQRQLQLLPTLDEPPRVSAVR